jgi:hypothetical protein
VLSNTTQPTQDGGKFGNSQRLVAKTEMRNVVRSKTSVTEELFLLRMHKTKKLNQLPLKNGLEEHINFGLSITLIT